MKMELLIYFLKLNIKESKELKLLKAIQDFLTMFPAQETCRWSRKCFRPRKSVRTAHREDIKATFYMNAVMCHSCIQDL